MSAMWTRTFWVQAAERAIKSVAQALMLLWAGDGLFNVVDVDWRVAAGGAAGAAVLSVLSSILTAGVGEKNSPSAVPVE